MDQAKLAEARRVRQRNLRNHLQNYIHAARRISKKYGVEVSVIKQDRKSLIPWIPFSGGVTIYAIIPRKDYDSVMRQIHEDPEFEFVGVAGMQPVNEVVEMIRQNPKVISYNIGGAGFIPPFFFNKEVYGNYGYRLRTELYAKFENLLEKQIGERVTSLKASGKELKRLEGKRKRQYNERGTKLVGPIEEKELLQQIPDLVEHIRKAKGEVLVAFDKSGRPVGAMLKKAIREAYGIKLPLFFISPTLAKEKILVGSKGPVEPDKLVELHAQLEKDNPLLIKAIAGKRVVLVDDQVWHGNSLSAVNALLKKYGPKNITNAYLSIFPAEPQPSWRSQGVQVTEHKARQLVARKLELTAEQREKYAQLRQKLASIAKRSAQKIKAGQKLKMRG